MNNYLKYIGYFVGTTVSFLILMQVLDSMGINTCIYDCDNNNKTEVNTVHDYVNDKKIK
uniref:Uncharacterized protein n=1 Tax=viral metagenome TaxID=1070528 RepID=A0A6C0C5F7_9ZZZZ